MQIGKTMAFIGAIVVAASMPLSGLMAEDFPSKPVQLVVPFKPGGGSDISARIFAKYASKYLPQKVVVTNIDGARGRAAELEVKRARPDGYMVLWQHQNIHMSVATGRSKYDYKAFDPVASTVRTDTALVVARNSPLKTAADLNTVAKAKPGTIRWGAAINGFSHFAYLAYLEAVGLDEKHFHTIGMSGDQDRVIAMMQGNLDVAIIALSAARPFLDSGDIVMLGVMAEERSEAYPTLPTLREQGINAPFYFDYMSFVPKGTPSDRIKILQDAWTKAVHDPDCRKELLGGWMIPTDVAGPKFEDYLSKQLKLFTDLAKKFHLVEEEAK
ncbi:MAG: tripartite tricarboxylate transporter substrate binding protein [Rhodospirillales bacterium]|nr:tripartite tricarboxylate transporter substrate binding protein [Rhodospirillales bacterium]